jgi:hypothetical protein
MPKTARPLPAPLAQAARRFAQWRKQRTTRSIPDPLWSLATRLGAEHGVSRTSRALGVDFYDLKKRVAAAEAPSSEKTTPPAFVEIQSAPARGPAEWVVEIEDGSGAKMRIQAMGASLPDLAALSRLFLKQRA